MLTPGKDELIRSSLVFLWETEEFTAKNLQSLLCLEQIVKLRYCFCCLDKICRRRGDCINCISVWRLLSCMNWQYSQKSVYCVTLLQNKLFYFLTDTLALGLSITFHNVMQTDSFTSLTQCLLYPLIIYPLWLCCISLCVINKCESRVYKGKRCSVTLMHQHC